jgi:imidazolonepropionase-like amidohydrolase
MASPWCTAPTPASRGTPFGSLPGAVESLAGLCGMSHAEAFAAATAGAARALGRRADVIAP